MTEEKLDSLAPGYSLVVNTPLLRGIQIAPAGGDGGNEKRLRFSMAQLLRSLDHPGLAPLREDPRFQTLRERVEAIAEE